MSEKIYVGNLPWSVSEAEIMDLFQPFGEVDSVDLITDRRTGRFRGFGFVEMDNAQAAVEGLNEQEMGGRQLKINIARERPEGREQRFNREDSEASLSTTKIYVGNLSWNSSEEEIKEVFSQYGEVTAVNIVTDSRTGRSRGFCFVEMDSIQAAIDALDNTELGGRNIRVQAAKERVGKY